ncbi:MAG: type III-A CRISPR-associated protein Cas10/Csm1 [Syntrophaceae bacterium]|nr:type III-A CRISPR-associated protein Cas10/Csm1 [Syntrophaceae bacterium]
MDETVLKVAIAGFMHDIGKFADKDTFNISEQFLMDNVDLYQPHYKEIYTHRHAVYTAAFIDHIEKLLPREFNRANWGLDDAFINLAAGHHKPGTPLQWIIAMADRIGSGWDRNSFEKKYNQAVAWKDYKKTRLLPIFENLMRDDGESNEYSYCYPLKEISPKNIFPDLQKDIRPNDNESAIAEYKRHFEQFIYALEHLLHKNENLELWFEHFGSLMMVFTSAIPAARAGTVIPDVSLYDHSKITAALAVALYLYHRDRDDMTVDSIKDYDVKKFLLISGDFYGIQNFIFSESGEAGKNRAKILRGRSFAVSLFSELAADMLCRSIGIPSSSILLNAAGKFTLIAPNTKAAQEAVMEVETRVNGWLMEISFGENAIGMTTLEASPEDFVQRKFCKLWDALNENTDRKKYQKVNLDKYGGAVTTYLNSFNNDLQHPLCPFCGKRPSCSELEYSDLSGDAQSICEICYDHIFLGKNLVNPRSTKKNSNTDEKRIAVAISDADIKGKKLLKPVFDEYQVFFPDGKMNEMARSGQLLKYWDVSINPEGIVAKDVTVKFINGYVPVYRKEDFSDDRIFAGKKSEKKKEDLVDQMSADIVKTFGHIANKALNPKENGGYCGIEALSILKADIDQLGILMSCGLKPQQFTLSRLAAMSRQLDFFFTVYLPHLLKTDSRFHDVYTVFAGGDDLFLIGPWNRIIDLVGEIRKSFADYVCKNSEIHFSAGISLHKPHTPLDKLADAAEAALERSKSADGKNSITLFSETASWDEFEQLQGVQETIQQWYENGLINNAMIYRLNEFVDMAESERRIIDNKEDVHIEDMECFK